MENLNLVSVIEKTLPALSGSSVIYNQNHNMFITPGYTSAAGNIYFKGIKLSNRIIISYDLGQGYSYLFLNGITIYGFDRHDKRLIASRFYHSCSFSELHAKRESVDMIKEYLEGQMKILNSPIDRYLVDDFANKLVEETLIQKQIG